MTIQLLDESVSIQRPLNQSALTREAFLSGKVRVNVGGKAEGASVKVQYEFGCQVNLDVSGSANAGFAGNSATPGTDPTTITNSDGTTGTINGSGTPAYPGGINSRTADAGTTISLSAGQVTTLPLISTTSSNITNTNDSNYNVNDYTFTGNSGGVAYSQQEVHVNGCAGYAAARALIQVTVSTDSVKGVVVLAGKQFSLG